MKRKIPICFGRSAGEKLDLVLMGKSIPGKHFKEMWPLAILKKLKEIRQKYDPSGVFD